MEVTQHTPADVRERVDVPGLPDGITPLTGVFTTHHAGRPHSIVLWQAAPWLVWQHPDGHWVTEAKVQVAALLRTPRGEEEAWRAFLDALDEFESAANLWVDPEGPTAEDMARLDRARQRVIECVRALATIRPEEQGDGPVGAVCANCGAPNAAIAGGELDPDEAVCSSECYDQLKELGCPQEHGGTYRPKPARRSAGGGA